MRARSKTLSGRCAQPTRLLVHRVRRGRRIFAAIVAPSNGLSNSRLEAINAKIWLIPTPVTAKKASNAYGQVR